VTSVLPYYPELGSDGIEEAIAPLSEHDAEIIGILRAEAPAGPRPTGTRPSAAVTEWLSEAEEYPFQSVIRHTAATLLDADPLAGCAELLADPDAVLVELLGRAENRVREVYIRPLVAALNHARERALLVGDTPRARYEHFARTAVAVGFTELGGPGFPLARRAAGSVVRNEVAAFRELCRRVRADRVAIAAMFGIEPTDPLASIGTSDGDAHNHGRSVSILRFASGARLAYKPRDVSCEAAYEHIAAGFNELLDTTLPALRVLARDRYGYVEFARAEDIAEDAEHAGEFMYACGELAGVLYLINAVDMHFENVVPTRRGPVPVDLETILHTQRVYAWADPEAAGNAHDVLGQSLYGMGLLPLVLIGQEAGSGHIDLGFLGGPGGGDAPFKSMWFEDPYTDRMRLMLGALPVQPRATVVESLTRDHVRLLGDRMAAGFARVYRAAMAERDACVALVRETTAGVRVRYLHNPTQLYAQMLRMTSSAHAADDVDVQLALLKRVAIASRSSARAVVLAEMRQLAGRDIPYFTIESTGVALETGDGAKVGAEVPRSPLERAVAKVERLSEFDLARQLSLIHSSFTARFPDNHLVAGAPATPAAAAPVSRSDLSTLAEELAGRLVAASLPDRFEQLPRTWIGPLASAEADRPWPPAVLGYDLYTGRLGPALALAAIGRALDQHAALDLAEQIFAATAANLGEYQDDLAASRKGGLAGFAGYTGLAGSLFALAAAGTALDRDDWVLAAREAVPPLLDQIVRRERDVLALDAIGGLAGIVSCVLAVGGPQRDAALRTLVDLMLDAGLPADVAEQSGFAHGVSGIVYALSRALPALPAEQRRRVRHALARLITTLHGFYDEAEENWFSNVRTPRRFATGWCHGATGIALALDAYHAVAPDAHTARMRKTAVRATGRLGFGRNLTWCHGDLGNHDVLRELCGPDDDRVREVERAWLRPEVLRRKIDDERSRYAHTSSLMVGTAGILLHLANRLDPDLWISPVTLTFEGR
jgi:type 2 lantibiotic biosynthesis protein LanM